MKRPWMGALFIFVLALPGTSEANKTHKHLTRADLNAALECVRPDGGRSTTEARADELRTWLLRASDQQAIVVQNVVSIKVLSKKETLTVKLTYRDKRTQQLRVLDGGEVGLDKQGNPPNWTLASCGEVLVHVHPAPPPSQPGKAATAD